MITQAGIDHDEDGDDKQHEGEEQRDGEEEQHGDEGLEGTGELLNRAGTNPYDAITKCDFGSLPGPAATPLSTAIGHNYLFFRGE